MNDFELQDPAEIKEEHSEVFTLRSINSEEQLLQVMPVFDEPNPSEQYRSGHWSSKQHIKYIMFIDFFSDIFTIKHNKKLWKIFTIMSAFIKTRNSSQCRSHHQKNQRKHKSIEEILELQTAKYKNYHVQFQKMKKVLRKLPIHNPIEVDNQKSTQAMIPSIKVLQENPDYKIYHNPVSMKNIGLSKKDIKEIKTRNSEKIIGLKKQKYIGSQVSIDMEDESEEGYNDKVRSLYVNEVDNQKCKEKIQHHHGSSFAMESSYQCKKADKLDRTADTYLDEGIRNLIKNNLKQNLKPVMQSENSSVLSHSILSQSIVQNVRNYINIVHMKKTRSSLPCFDDFQLEAQDIAEMARLGQRLRKSKKDQGNPDGKCKTLPPRSVQIESSEESWLTEKKDHEKSIRKSLFSGFVSSLEEVSEGNEKFYQPHNFHNFSNFAYENQFNAENEKMMDFRGQQNVAEGDFVEPKINLIFREDPYKDANKFRLEQPVEKQPDKELLDSRVRNFTKKRSRQPQSISQEKNQDTEKQEGQQTLKRQTTNEVWPSDQQYYTQQQNFLSNSEVQMPSMENIYQAGYVYPQNPVTHVPSAYGNYWFVPQQYPFMEYKFYKFMEFFLYYLGHKIYVDSFYYQPI